MEKVHINNYNFIQGQFFNTLSIRNKIFSSYSGKKNIFFWKEILFHIHQSSSRYLTYSYLTIFYKVVIKDITYTNIFILQPDLIH